MANLMELNYYLLQTRQTITIVKLDPLSQLIGKKYINSKLRRYSEFLIKVQRYCIVALNSSQEAESYLVEFWNT